MYTVNEHYNKRDFWIRENLQYTKPHFRLSKVGRLINDLVGKRKCDLLDVGCGPAALRHVLRENIRYHGVDIAIHSAAPNLAELDFIECPIAFDSQTFDVVVAQGVFEYIGKHQSQKFLEIAALLRRNGLFVASYVNFDHRDAQIYAPYNNIQALDAFTSSLTQYFNVERRVPTSHHIHHHEPSRWYMKRIQMHVNCNIPLLSRYLAVEYLFVCSPKNRVDKHA